jgi:hypothetical protein
MTAPLQLLLIRLQLAPVNPLVTPHGNPHRASCQLLAQAFGPSGQLPLFDL